MFSSSTFTVNNANIFRYTSVSYRITIITPKLLDDEDSVAHNHCCKQVYLIVLIVIVRIKLKKFKVFNTLILIGILLSIENLVIIKIS
jgi:hypothetical protein